jgi:hypothetical protein
MINFYHHPKQMKKELDVHGLNVNNFIIAHDTMIINGRRNESFHQILAEYGNKFEWSVIERGIEEK